MVDKHYFEPATIVFFELEQDVIATSGGAMTLSIEEGDDGEEGYGD